MTEDAIRSLLEGGSRRSLGRAGEVADLLSSHPEDFPILIGLLWDPDPIVCMRAADTAEKVSRDNHRLLHPWKRELLGLLTEAVQQELRWHLALMIPRLNLTAAERRRAAPSLEEYLNDRSSIVKTLAMQGLADLAAQDAKLRPEIVDKVATLTRTGTPAMRARGRKLLASLLAAPGSSKRKPVPARAR